MKRRAIPFTENTGYHFPNSKSCEHFEQMCSAKHILALEQCSQLKCNDHRFFVKMPIANMYYYRTKVCL